MWFDMSLSEFDKMLDDFDIIAQINNNICIKLSLLCALNLCSLYVVYGHIFSTITNDL